ncbi:hypothetical protein Tco_1105583 [Tanacetum coccineum]
MYVDTETYTARQCSDDDVDGEYQIMTRVGGHQSLGCDWRGEIRISSDGVKDPRLGIDQTNRSFWGQVTSEYNWHASIKRSKGYDNEKWITLNVIATNFARVSRKCTLSVKMIQRGVARCYKTFRRGQIWFALSTKKAWDVLKDHHK